MRLRALLEETARRSPRPQPSDSIQHQQERDVIKSVLVAFRETLSGRVDQIPSEMQTKYDSLQQQYQALHEYVDQVTTQKDLYKDKYGRLCREYDAERHARDTLQYDLGAEREASQALRIALSNAQGQHVSLKENTTCSTTTTNPYLNDDSYEWCLTEEGEDDL